MADPVTAGYFSIERGQTMEARVLFTKLLIAPNTSEKSTLKPASQNCGYATVSLAERKPI